TPPSDVPSDPRPKPSRPWSPSAGHTDSAGDRQPAPASPSSSGAVQSNPSGRSGMGEPDAMVGAILDGRYRLTALARQGSTATSYHATRVDDDHPLLVKVLST